MSRNEQHDTSDHKHIFGQERLSQFLGNPLITPQQSTNRYIIDQSLRGWSPKGTDPPPPIYEVRISFHCEYAGARDMVHVLRFN